MTLKRRASPTPHRQAHGTTLSDVQRCLIVAGVFAATGFDLATATQMPTDVELRAAYCLAVTQIDIDSLERAKGDVAAVQQDIDTMSRDAKDRANRLQLYLTPKMQVLDPAAIRGAIKRGETDHARFAQKMNEVGPACATACQVTSAKGEEAQDKAMQCYTGCTEKDELIARVRSCGQLNWLPF